MNQCEGQEVFGRDWDKRGNKDKQKMKARLS